MNSHYDIAAAEAAMRHDIAMAAEHGEQLVAEGVTDASFLRAQRYFDEARIQFVLACLAAENAGVDRNELLSAAGFSIGSVWGSVLRTGIGARERAIINGWVQQALALSIGMPAAQKTVESTFKPMEGSRA